MKTLAGSKRSAGTPFASPTKAAASVKRSRTQYDYYDEEDSEPLPEDQWSPGVDSGSEMSLDGGDELDSPSDRIMARPRASRPHEDSWDIEVMPMTRFANSGF